MEKRIAGMVLSLAAVISMPFALEGKVVLVYGGKSDYEIIIRADAPAVTVYAAKELQGYLLKVCDVSVPVRTEPTAGLKAIFVGAHPLLAGKPELDSARFKEEERFLIQELDGGGIAIMGADCDVNPESLEYANFGLLFGVYEFIENFLGVRWYAPGPLGECFRPMSDVEVSGLPLEQKAGYWWRYYYPEIFNECSVKDSYVWGRRLKGYGMKPYSANHSMMDLYYVYKDSHPQIFALNSDGSRHFGEPMPDRKGWHEFPQYCFSHPDTLQAFLDLVDAVYEDKPAGREWQRCRPDNNFVYVIPDDNYRPNPCYCEGCKAKMEPSRGPKGVQSQLVWEFVAKVAEHVQKKYPGTKVVGLPYEGFLMPPKNLKLPDNVVAHICVNPYVIYSGLPEYDRLDEQILADWAGLVGEISVWHYFLPYADFPYLMPRRLAKWYASHPKVKASFIELMDTGLRAPNLPKNPAHKGIVATDLAQSHLNLYFSMKGMWGAPFDIGKELDTYYELFHGPAAGPMREFNETIISRWENVRGVEAQNTAYAGFSGKDIYEKIYPKELTDRLEQLVRQAEALTKPGTIYRERIEWIRKSYFNAFKAVSDAYDREAKSSKNPVVFIEKGKPSVDGEVLDEYWKDKEEHSFRRNDAPLPPRFPTRFKMGMDNDNIYVALVAEDPDSSAQRVVNNAKDAQVYCDDSYEIFLCPDPKRPDDYYQIAVNLNDFVFDHKVENKKSDISWDSGIVTKTRRLEGRWISEAAIPLKNMGLKAEDGASWRFNVCRSKRSGVGENGEFSQLHTTYGGFLNTSAIPAMSVVRRDGAPYCAVFDSAAIPFNLTLDLFDKEHRKRQLKEGVAAEFRNGSMTLKINFPKSDAAGEDSAAMVMGDASGAELKGSPFCEIRYRNPDSRITLMANYSFEAEDGRTYSDYFRFSQNEAHHDWRITSFNIQNDGYYAGERKKAGEGFFPAPVKLLYFAIYAIRGDSSCDPLDAEVGLSYARFVGKPLKAGFGQ